MVRLLDYLSLDECGKELCLIVKTDNEVYALQDDLMVDVFISINGKKEYKGLPHVLDMDVYNARGVTDLAYSFLAWSIIFLNSASLI